MHDRSTKRRSDPTPPRVSYFVTCVADQFGAEAAAAGVRLLRAAGCKVAFPADQTCCGQPAFNAGFHDDARKVARHWLDVFERRLSDGDEYIVTPSGSCGAMIHHFASLFEHEPDQAQRASRLAERTFELTQFLVDVLGVEATGARLEGRTIAYHDSCHALRNLGVQEQPRALLRAAGANLVDWDASCCGFGGLFAIKLPELSSAMMRRKLDSLAGDGGAATILTSTDLGCLMQLSGGLARRGAPIQVVHVAELLAPTP